ncbi:MULTISPECIES: LysR family transcriptional regulator [Caballeronia]|uniref:LysR family transcriptional regulator n=1 Tax=Caballeronia TaxID=1827195 RepID=UPI00025BB9B6|nr:MULTISPECIES: LysR substrate-binding domain-containing protein [Caballeronia]EKS72476.1 LysR family transcriptional regulator [Burkholderia sp. SJ98]MCE4548070.1 LysR substrate-binding domain-containing protein [Caballeronia sp. PC1]MCE4575908.1 LysR substrate-binding domain-containing protein [Caballeronia sp. CLC5]
MGLKLRQIEAFRAVMRAGSMTAAAEILSIGQPAVSYQISTLETAVGFALFNRAKGKLTPTAEAYQLLAEVDRLYDGLSGIEAAAVEIAGHHRAILRVLLTSAFSNTLIVGAIGRFAATHPGLRMDLDAAHRPAVVRNVANGLADIGIVSLPVNVSRIIVEPLFTSELVCVLPRIHPLADRAAVTPDDLASLPLIAMKPGGVIRPILERWFTAAGLHPIFEYEVRDAWAAIELVRAGLGVAVVSRISAASQIGMYDDHLTTIAVESIEGVEVAAIMPETDGGNRTAASLLAFLKDNLIGHASSLASHGAGKASGQRSD